jgi:hypothetical protein
VLMSNLALKIDGITTFLWLGLCFYYGANIFI